MYFFSRFYKVMAYQFTTDVSIQPATIRGVLKVDTNGDVEQNDDSGAGKKVFTSFTGVGVDSDWLTYPPVNISRSKNFYSPHVVGMSFLTPSVARTTTFLGAVLGNDGYVYAVPFSGTPQVLRAKTLEGATTYDLLTPTVSIGTFRLFHGAVYAQNNKIYFIPLTSQYLLIYNTATDTYTSVNVGVGSDKWTGGVLAPNGKIYCAPFNSTSVLIIDTSNDTIDTSTITGIAGTGKYTGCVLSKEGNIYCVPFSAATILKIDPNTDTTSSFGAFVGVSKWDGGCVAPDGNIYMTPFGQTDILSVDTAADTTSTIATGIVSAGANWWGCTLAPNNHIYFCPFQYPDILDLDLDTMTTSLITTGFASGGSLYSSSCLGLDGSVYFMPNTATDMLRYVPPKTKTGLELQYCYSCYRNKF